jgi:hypothetical protein
MTVGALQNIRPAVTDRRYKKKKQKGRPSWDALL